MNTTVDTKRDLPVVVLTGKPASGKSTVAQFFADEGWPVRDTGDAIREEAHRRHDDPDEDQVWEVAQAIRQDHGPAGPTKLLADWIQSEYEAGADAICVSSVREQAEVDWLDEHVGPTLVVEVSAPDSDRQQRYIDEHVGGEVVDRQTELEVAEGLYEREYREMPYPDADVRLPNPNGDEMYTVMERVCALMEVIEA